MPSLAITIVNTAVPSGPAGRVQQFVPPKRWKAYAAVRKPAAATATVMAARIGLDSFVKMSLEQNRLKIS